MKLIVGLGNPGDEYKNTRHNVGFRVLESYSIKYNLSFSKNKFSGSYCETSINGEKVIFLKPLKYMNLSGEVVKDYVNYFKIDIEDILIINDDLDIDIGNIKLKFQGSSGGHNGLKNIEENLNTQTYKRLKIGISDSNIIDTKDYVLGKFTEEEKLIIDKVILTCVDIIDDYFKLTFENLMNKYN